MANYYFCTTYGNATKALSHSSYILGKDKYDYKEDEVLYCDSKFPSWAKDEKEFWEAVSYNERANGRGYREFRFSLPNELSLEENMNIVDDFIKNTLKDNFYYTAVIHNKETNSFDKKVQNIHCHLMFNERKIDGIKRTPEQFFKRANTKEPQKGGAKKSIEFNSKDKLLELRKDMEVLINSYYEKNGFEERVTCESLEKQKEIAESEGDNLKAEFLDRRPINIDGYLLKKPIEKMTEEERIDYEIFILTKQSRDIKLDIYNLKKSELEDQIENDKTNIKDISDEIENNKNVTNVFDEYISNEKNIVEIENEILKTNKFINDIELRTLFNLDKESYNVFRSKELLEKELFVMENYESKNEIYYENRAKLEEKIFKYETALEISLNNLKTENLDKFEVTKESLLSNSKDRLSNLEINKLNLLKETNTLININDDKSNHIHVLENSFDYNFKTFIATKKDLINIDNEISKLENNLSNKLKEITLNKLTNGQYLKFENQKEIYENKIKRCDRIILEDSQKDINAVKRERNIYSEKLFNLNETSKKLYNSLDKNKYDNLKHSLEIKMKDKLITLTEEKIKLNEILSIHKSNFINTDTTKTNLDNHINERNLELYTLDNQFNQVSKRKNYIQEYYSNDTINELAYTKLFKGENLKLRNDFEKIEKNIEEVYLKLNNSNLFEKISLNKEKKSLEISLTKVKEKYSNLYRNVNPDEFRKSVNTIIESKQKALNGLEKIETNIKENIKNTKFELYSLKSIKIELYPYNGIKSKQDNINFNKLIDHAQTGGGGQEKIESFFDELEKENRKAKSRDFER